MYNFQRKQLRKQKSSDAEATKDSRDPNGNISTIDAIALASEAKGQPNGIVSNVLHEHICDHSCRIAGSTTCLNGGGKAMNGIDNKAYMPDLVDGAAIVEVKSENNTHL